MFFLQINYIYHDARPRAGSAYY
jgi:hypothetical protein